MQFTTLVPVIPSVHGDAHVHVEDGQVIWTLTPGHTLGGVGAGGLGAGGRTAGTTLRPVLAAGTAAI